VREKEINVLIERGYLVEAERQDRTEVAWALGQLIDELLAGGGR
jgi:hypothetical protein